ncbi:MAG TPA: hypothetical protein VF444_11915 [Pseudonocardiaceae bacterium]
MSRPDQAGPTPGGTIGTSPGPMAITLTLAAVTVEAVVLVVLEVFFLPLRFDGTLLPNIAGNPPFPITVLLAVLTTPWLVARACEVTKRFVLAGLPLWAWLAVLAVLGLTGDNSEGQVVLQDWRLLLLLAGGALPSVVVLGRSLGQHQADRRRTGAGR